MPSVVSEKSLWVVPVCVELARYLFLHTMNLYKAADSAREKIDSPYSIKGEAHIVDNAVTLKKLSECFLENPYQNDLVSIYSPTEIPGRMVFYVHKTPLSTNNYSKL